MGSISGTDLYRQEARQVEMDIDVYVCMLVHLEAAKRENFQRRQNGSMAVGG